MRFLASFAIVSLSLIAVEASAVTIYDTISPSGAYTRYSGAGNTRAADNFLPLPVTTPGDFWTITDISFVAFASAAGTYTLPVTINFYNAVGTSAVATDPALTSLAGTINTSIVGFSAASAGSGAVFSLSSLNVALAPTSVTASGYAVELVFGANTVGGGNLSPGYRQVGSAVAGSAWSNGFFIDTSNNGVLQNNEFVNFTGWANGNMAVSLGATETAPVPEPTSIAALSLGAVALLRHRRKR